MAEANKKATGPTDAAHAENSKLIIRWLPAETIVHLNGIPFILVESAKVISHKANFDQAGIYTVIP